MKILAIDFSSPCRSVAVVSGPPSTPVLLGRSIQTGQEHTHAIEMIHASLEQARCEREEIECIAIGIGPGSYTGIRSAIAVAQGWQLALPVSLCAISSMDCIAAEAWAQGLRGLVHLLVDAQRNEFYYAAYALSAEGWTHCEPVHLASRDEVQAKARSGGILAGPENLGIDSVQIIHPDAAQLGYLALKTDQRINGGQIQPIYLRETQFVKAPPPRISI